MAADNRDWYRDLLRKKTGYAERAKFRASYADMSAQIRASKVSARKSSFWWFVLYGAIVASFVIVAIKVTVRFLK